MNMEIKDCFIQKCPSCERINRKGALNEEHTCDCGFVWEAIHNSFSMMNQNSKLEL